MLRIVALVVAVCPLSWSMHCLVTRPGYGLVSEQCPPATVACRIRIDKNAVEFYEYSPLYDRNQFVCVLKNEYGNMERSGCVEKRTGKIRCWCYGRSNCNSAENSKKLYEAFKSGNQELFHETIEEIDFPNLHSDELSGMSSTTIESSTTLTTERQRLANKFDSHSSSSDAQSSATSHDVLKASSLPMESHVTVKSPRKMHHNHKNHKHHQHSTTTEQPMVKTEPIQKEHIYKSPIIKASKEEKQSAFMSVPVPANAPGPSFSKFIVRPPPNYFEAPTTTTKSVASTQKSNVKVIYVNSKDKYQNVIGSEEFRKALHLDGNEPPEPYLLPTDSKKKLADNLDSFNTEYNENERNSEDTDSLSDFPMTDQEADLYLSDETRIPRVKTRSKDLDEYPSAGVYYDSSAISLAQPLAVSSFMFLLSTLLLYV